MTAIKYILWRLLPWAPLPQPSPVAVSPKLPHVFLIGWYTTGFE